MAQRFFAQLLFQRVELDEGREVTVVVPGEGAEIVAPGEQKFAHGGGRFLPGGGRGGGLRLGFESRLNCRVEIAQLSQVVVEFEEAQVGFGDRRFAVACGAGRFKKRLGVLALFAQQNADGVG